MGVVVKIQRHIKKGWKFALSTGDLSACIVVDPKCLSAGYSTGDFITYTDRETMINCIQLALYEYTEFTSLHEPKLDKPPAKLIQL